MYRKPFSTLWVGVFLLAVLGLLIFPAHTAQASIRLTSFTATAGTDKIDLRWETASEVGTAGFYIQRSVQESTGYSRVSSFIPVNGDALTGSIYTYSDAGLANGTYYYRLEAVNTNGSSEIHGPAFATVGSTATATSTLSGKNSVTPSVTPSATVTPSSTIPSSTTAPLTSTASRTSTRGATLTPSVTTQPGGPSATALNGTSLAATAAAPTTAALLTAYPAATLDPHISAPSAATARPYPAPTSLTPAAAAPTPAPSGSGLPVPLLVLGGSVLALLVGLGAWGGINSLRGGKHP
jgi:hypothetical protein